MSTEIPWDGVYENQPIEGYVSITHDKTAQVDTNSFKMGKAPLKVSLYKEVALSDSSPVIISLYQFTIPGMAKGLQLLPAVSVKVGGKPYQSAEVSFEVLSGARQREIGVPNSQSAFLKLEAFIANEQALYPGLKTQVGYRYLFNTNIELTEEYLPLLEMANFRNSGDKDIQDRQIGDVSVHTIIQNVEALQPGTFYYGPSLIKGYAYKEERGKRIYLEPQLVSEAPQLKVTVLDFPEDNKPASFNGAVGNFNFNAHLLSSNQLRIGDQLEIELVVIGEGQLESVQPPQLCCQPNFSGFFKMSDLPPIGKIQQNRKSFLFQITPLFADIAAIPPIEFSFFNPATLNYKKKLSDPIPIQISPAPHQDVPAQSSNANTFRQPDKIQPNYVLVKADLHNQWFGSWWVLGTLPIALFALFLQQAYIQKRDESKMAKAASDVFFEQAIFEADRAKAARLLAKAYLQLFFEKSLISQPKTSIEALPNESPFLEVKSLFSFLNRDLYALSNQKEYDQVFNKAKELFQRLRRS